MSELRRITINPAICGSRPTVRGLRLRVTDILQLLAAGASRDEILADFPYLEAGDITAVLEFAVRLIDNPGAPALWSDAALAQDQLRPAEDEA